MPIYAYICKECGFEKDALQKLSDPPLTVCPSCSKESLVKKLTAPNFQLKGSGWYVTDFRDGGKKPDDAKADSKGGAEPAGTPSKPDTGAANTGPGAGASAASPAPSGASASGTASPGGAGGSGAATSGGSSPGGSGGSGT